MMSLESSSGNSKKVVAPLDSADMDSAVLVAINRFQKKEVVQVEMSPEDKDTVTEIEEKHKSESEEDKRAHLYAKALEILTVNFGNSWLPGFPSEASKFDDFVRGTDVIIELEDDNGSVYRFAIDVTISTKKIDKKIERVFDELARGGFRKIKYFTPQLEERSDSLPPAGDGEFEMPIAIAGFEFVEAESLARFLLKLSKPNITNIEKDKYVEEIKRHRFGFELMEQILREFRSQILSLENSNLSAKPDTITRVNYLKNIISIIEAYKTNIKNPLESENAVQRAILRIFENR